MIFACSPLLCSAQSPADPAAKALHQIIDQHLSAPAGVNTGLCSDAEFLRRAAIDLTGMPPKADTARSFITDISPDKRIRLINELIASPHFDRQLATSLDIMLMERRANTNVPQDEWMAWLLNSVRHDKPWNTMVREILTADGEDAAQRAPARFTLDRGGEPNVIARDIGRIFFARDLQCAQCHDSPLVSDFLQSDYQGLLAFIAPSYGITQKIGEKDVVVLAEKSPLDLSFESVFLKGIAHRTGPRLPGDTAMEEPFFFPGEEYSTAPADKVKSVPKLSRRALLAARSTSGSNAAFNRNIANRLWAFVFGRGLVHPPDMIHAGNPAASEPLLAELGQHIAAMNFDMRAFVKELALTRVYQAPFDLPAVTGTTTDLAAAELIQLQEQEKLLRTASKNADEAWDKALTDYDQAEAAFVPVAVEVDTLRTQYSDTLKKRDDAVKAVTDAATVLETRKKLSETLQQAAASAGQALLELPSESELSAAAEKLKLRAEQVSTELPALQKDLDDKSGAVAPATEALSAARSGLESGLEKLKPLRATLQAADLERVRARSGMQNAAATLASAEKRIAATLSVSESARQMTLLVAARDSVPVKENQFASATQLVTQFAPRISETSAAVASAQQGMMTAEQTVQAMRDETERYEKLVSSLDEAHAAVERANSVAEDSGLSETASMIQARLNSRMPGLKSLKDQLVQAESVSAAAATALRIASAEMDSTRTELERLRATAAAAEASVQEAREALLRSQSETAKSANASAAELAGRFTLSSLKPLSPEQLCWTIFRVTTVYDRYAAAEHSELDKTAPLTEQQKADPAALKAREIDVEQRVYDKLKGNIATYVQFYGGGPGQPQGDFYASPDQALFTSNATNINSWIVPSGDNPTERIVKAADARVAAEELYLGILTRMPTEEETAEVAGYLSSRPDRTLAAQELVWGLVTSAEFRFNR